jgi:phage baseplate assembly protein W
METTYANYKTEPYGRGVVAPMRRGVGGDFQTSTGVPLLKASVHQIVTTQPGDLVHRPEFGVDLDQFRHRNITPALGMAAASEIVMAISIYEPRVTISSVSVTKQPGSPVLNIKVTWQPSAEYGGDVQMAPEMQEIAA